MFEKPVLCNCLITYPSEVIEDIGKVGGIGRCVCEMHISLYCFVSHQAVQIFPPCKAQIPRVSIPGLLELSQVFIMSDE